MSDEGVELRRRYQAAFASLPWMQREIFLARRLDGYSYAEIAWLMRVNEGFIERQMARAIYKAREADGRRALELVGAPVLRMNAAGEQQGGDAQPAALSTTATSP